MKKYLTVKCGCDYIRDEQWNPRKFSSQKSIIRYATESLKKDYKTSKAGFVVSLFKIDESTFRLNYCAQPINLQTGN